MSNSAMLNYIGTIKYLGSMKDLSTKGRLGDICTYNGQQYVYNSTEWEPFGTDTIIYSDYKTYPKICSQCGAPLFSNTCEYCGTRYR